MDPVILLLCVAILSEISFQQQIAACFNRIFSLHSTHKNRNPKTTKFLSKLKKRTPRRYLPRHRRHQPPRQQGDILSVDIRAKTGLDPDEFESLFEQLRFQISSPRRVSSLNRPSPALVRRETPTSLSPRFRLLLVLEWLREYSHYKVLSETYGISVAQVSREISHILPKLYTNTPHTISWPPVWRPYQCLGSFQITGAIDCTCHFRNRVHPYQSDWYVNLFSRNSTLGIKGIELLIRNFGSAIPGIGETNSVSFWLHNLSCLFLERSSTLGLVWDTTMIKDCFD